MTIQQLVQLGLQVKEAQIQGVIKKAWPTKQMQGQKGPFTCQNIVVSDPTGEIAVGMIVKDAPFVQGAPITLDVRPRAWTDKQGVNQVGYNGTVVNVPATAPYAPQPQQGQLPLAKSTTPDVQAIVVRQNVLNRVCDLIIAKEIVSGEEGATLKNFERYCLTGQLPDGWSGAMQDAPPQEDQGQDENGLPF